MKVIIRYLICGVLCGIFILIWVFTRSSPQNLPNKAIEIKKTYNKQSKECEETYVSHITAKKTFPLPILLYHYVENVEDKDDIYRIKMNVTPVEFERHVARLVESGYTSIFVRDIKNIIKNPDQWCYPAVALTFDDGYADFYKDVFPILKKYNIKATVYLIVKYIGRDDFLNEGQIQELIGSGLVEIGSHTMDHADLTTLDSRSLSDQILVSKRLLESTYNIKVESFSYPLGKYNEAVMIQVRLAGYSSAVTVKKGAEHTREDFFDLKRVRPENFFNIRSNSSFPGEKIFVKKR